MAGPEGSAPTERGTARRRGTYAVRGAIVAFVGALIAAISLDRWHTARELADARAEVREAATVRADALRSSTTRELSLLLALVSFTESRRTRAELDAEFPTFAQGVFSERGLRALQLVEGGRIVSTWPIEGNEPAMGFDLRQHPDPRVRVDLERALTSTVVTITGPVRLVQGGLGLLVRKALQPRAGFPQLAAVILDVDRLVRSAGIPDATSGLWLELRDRDGSWFAGDPDGRAKDPEVISILTADGNFQLRAAPTEGWASLMEAEQRSWRRGATVLVLVAGLFGWLLGRRRDRLESEVSRSSTALRLVMRENRMGGWEEELTSGEVKWSPTLDAMIGRPAGDGQTGVAALLGAVDPLDRQRLGEMLVKARTGEVDEFVEEVRLGGGGGVGRWMLIVASVARDHDGRPKRLNCALAEAGEQRALEERLRHSQRLEALAKLASGVATDFDDLISAIVRHAERARERTAELPAEEAEIVLEDIDHVIATARRGSRLTDQLFSFSRGPLTETPALDVAASVAELVPTLERLLAGRARLQHESAPDVPRVLVDSGQFAQVLMNLVVNARDAMPEGGTVLVRTSFLDSVAATRPSDAPPGRWVLVEVQDEGTGIPASVRDRIFEPYFTTKPEGRGTGLGLSVVFGIIEAAGGTVTVSTEERRGSTFHVFLPPHAVAAT
jgi:signal transduction histidine kinase